MSRQLMILLATLFSCPGVLLSLQQVGRADLVIQGVGVVNVDTGTTAPHHVVVRGASIAELLPEAESPPPSAATLDGRGRFLVPGLWDMHVHLATQPAAELAEDVLLPLYLANGIVGVRDMGGPLERVLSLRDRVQKGNLLGPRIITPGPFVDGAGEPDPLFRRAPSPVAARAAVGELAAAGVDFIKVQASLLREPHRAILAEARRRNLPVAGHVPVALPVMEVIASGQRTIEHISPALIGDAGLLFACSTREAALRAELADIERDRAAAAAEQIRRRESALRAQLVKTYDAGKAGALGRALRERGVVIVPTLIWSNSLRPLHAADGGNTDQLVYVPAAMRKRLQEARARHLAAATADALAQARVVAELSARAVNDLHAAGATVVAGTDSFDGFVIPGFSLHQELSLLVGAGLEPIDALRAATIHAARVRATSAQEGSIAPGKRADLVLLDGNPLADVRHVERIHAVVLGGRPFTRRDLDGLLSRARTAAAR